MKELPKVYDPRDVESRIYKLWMDGDCFKAEPNPDKKPFSIVMPPPNVTGQLHMGHALDCTLQDILTRFKRMQGYEALWLPGSDHAGIATQIKVEEELRKNEGLTRYDLGREKFLERVWAWKEKYGSRIVEQQKKMGASCDWSRDRFTMDEGCSRAVRETFCELYEKGLIYKGSRIINWCPHCLTALSDAEVEYTDKPGNLWYIRYPLADGSGDIVIATTRPETMFGDTGVAVNPEDEKFKHLIGKTCILPIMNREIPIVGDDYCEIGFGTGAVKMTPAHDPNDFEVGLRHNLEVIRCISDDGTMNENAGKYQGMDRYACRKAVVADLEADGYLVKTEPYSHNVGTCYRCHNDVEPLISAQWFVKMAPLAKEAIRVVEDGPIVFDGTLSQPTAEGPKMYKRNGWYYIFIPAGGVEYGWQTVLRARNVYGPYEEKIVMHQGASSINGPHQGAWVTAPDGSDWFLHFQDRFELGRVVHLQPMCWHSDWPFIGLEQNGDGIGEPVTEWDCPKGEAGSGLQIGDSFTNGKPGLQWQWQANPQPEAWLRPVAGDALHLVCGASGSLWRQPNVLSQMLPAADFTANVTLGLAGCGAGAKVGLSVMGQKYSAIELCRTAQGCTVQLVQGMVKDLAPTGDAEETILAEKMVDTDEITVTMKITAAKQVQYALLAADGTAVPLGGAQPVAKATWTGARLALYARGGTKGDAACIKQLNITF